MITQGIFNLLSQDAQISALIGQRIIPVLLPEACDLPAVTYQIVGGSSSPTFQTSGMQRLRMQFDCFGKNYSDATLTRDAIRKLLNGYQGLLSDGTFLQNADLIQSVDFFENEALIYRCMIEFYL